MIVLGIIYYMISSFIFLRLYEKEAFLGVLNKYGEMMCFIPIIRSVYYIHLKF